MPSAVRDTLSWLAHLIDANLPLRTSQDDYEYARARLAPEGGSLVALRETLGPLAAPAVARSLAADIGRHPPADIAGRYTDESPTWQRLKTSEQVETVPASLVATFEAQTLLEAPVVVAIDTRWAGKEIVVHVRAAHSGPAEAYLHGLLDRALGRENHLKGRCLHVSSRHSMEVTEVPRPDARRQDVIAPPAVWTEIDANVSALFSRRRLLGELGLGTNRGLLLVGPPGTGKSAVCRVLAAELAGSVTVVFCAASAIVDDPGALYGELAPLAPTLVLMEDLDLVVGRRGRGRDEGLHAFLTAVDGAMSHHDGVVTVATTNDLAALDPAAIRAARFDRIIELPLPDEAARAAILRRYLGPLAARVDPAAIAARTGGASGADLRELVRRAVLAAGEQVRTRDVLAAVRDDKASAPGLYL
jgi:hypothetical protein